MPLRQVEKYSVSKIRTQNDHSLNKRRTSEGKEEGMHLTDSKWIEYTGFDEKCQESLLGIRCPFRPITRRRRISRVSRKHFTS